MKVNLYTTQQGISPPVLICNSAGLWYVAMNKLQVNFCLMTNQSTSTPSLFSQYTARKVMGDNHDETLRVQIATITIKAYFQQQLVVVLKWMCSKTFSRWPFQFATEKVLYFCYGFQHLSFNQCSAWMHSYKASHKYIYFFLRKNTLYLSLSRTFCTILVLAYRLAISKLFLLFHMFL